MWSVFLAVLIPICAAQQNGDLRLADSSLGSNGRVEIYLNNEWGTILYDTFLDQEGAAQAICRQLGFSNVLQYGTVTDMNYTPAKSNVQTLISSVYCLYNSNVLDASQHVLRCNYDFVSTQPDDHHDDFAVECYSYSVTPYDTQVRLAGGNQDYRSSGFLEVYLNGRWGPVCNVEEGEADSACKQLGYTGALNFNDQNSGYFNDSAVLNAFYCSGFNGTSTITSACLRNCFDYPSADTSIYCPQNSFITCTFNIAEQYNSYGSESLCSLDFIKHLIGLIVGITVGVFIFLVLVVCAIVVCCCCCIPGCVLYGTRRRGTYQVINP